MLRTEEATFAVRSVPGAMASQQILLTFLISFDCKLYEAELKRSVLAVV